MHPGLPQDGRLVQHQHEEADPQIRRNQREIAQLLAQLEDAQLRKTPQVDHSRVRDLGPVKVPLGETGSKIVARLSTVEAKSGVVGVPVAFSIHSLWPLYSWFFHSLGVRVELSDRIAPEGIAKQESNYCFPAEIAHGMIQDVLDQGVDYVFLPHFRDMPSMEAGKVHACVCPLTQGLPFLARQAFAVDENVLRPVAVEITYAAGLYALLTATLMRDEDLRTNMIRYSARWLVPAFLLLPIGGLWYLAAIPEEARELLQAQRALVGVARVDVLQLDQEPASEKPRPDVLGRQVEDAPHRGQKAEIRHVVGLVDDGDLGGGPESERPPLKRVASS